MDVVCNMRWQELAQGTLTQSAHFFLACSHSPTEQQCSLHPPVFFAARPIPHLHESCLDSVIVCVMLLLCDKYCCVTKTWASHT